MCRGGIVIGSATGAGEATAAGGQEKVHLVVQVLHEVDAVRARDMVLELQQFLPSKSDFAPR